MPNHRGEALTPNVHASGRVRPWHHHMSYMLAGPLGQCHAIPDDPQLKAEMLKHARNHHRIHNMYNLPYQSEPGSDMAKVSHLERCILWGFSWKRRT